MNVLAVIPARYASVRLPGKPLVPIAGKPMIQHVCERDAEGSAANDYAVFRYDMTRLGRFPSPDPLSGSIADPLSLNRYAYTRNDPVNLADPYGLTFFCVTAGGSTWCEWEPDIELDLTRLGSHGSGVPMGLETATPQEMEGPPEGGGNGRLSAEEVKDLVRDFNFSPLSDELIFCIIQKESGFNPNAVPLDKSGNPIAGASARGLMQVTRGAASDVEKAWPNAFPSGLYNRLFDPATNIAAGSTYLDIRLVHANFDLKKALAGYGTGDKYANDILDCEKKLKAGH